MKPNNVNHKYTTKQDAQQRNDTTQIINPENYLFASQHPFKYHLSSPDNTTNPTNFPSVTSIE
ncbi:hypothetical protein E2C01_085334 [Portunus trituberculatus]|uniref:Uncharacterized protein n=1 Tax=Portunus trituberculatus TaxID=210409 RepID=A0A5B7J7B8_PORTR|nr:hypothetical protein [Portunus trituberculatus]